MVDWLHPAPTGVQSDLPPGRCIRVSGSRYDIGYQHGTSQREDIHRFLDDRLTRIAAIMGKPVSLPDLAGMIAAHAAIIRSHLPALTEEVRGLADGAGISLEQAYLLQLRRELVGYRSVKSWAAPAGTPERAVPIPIPGGDCTCFGRLSSATGTVLGQTIDLNGDMAPELRVLQVELADSARRVMLVSFTGLLGYLGMNDRGLAIGLNLVLGGTWRPGIPGYMAIRHLLDEAATVEECLCLLAALPLASSRAMTITDGTRLVMVEHILDEMVVVDATETVHTNHFLHPGFAERDELNPFARTSSLRRLEACTATLAALPADAPAQAYLDMLAAPSIHVAPNGDVRRECTVGSVVMFPTHGTMHVRQAAPWHA